MPKFRKARNAEMSAPSTSQRQVENAVETSTITEQARAVASYRDLVGTSLAQQNNWAQPLETTQQIPVTEPQEPPPVATKPPEGVVIIPAGELRFAEPAGPKQQQTDNSTANTSSKTTTRLAISDKNIGYKLLQKEGWKPGTGIGKAEQGNIEPLQPQLQSGKLGLGAVDSKKKQKQAAAGVNDSTVGQQTTTKQQQQREKRPLPSDPLAEEDIDSKVKRVQQVLQHEADDKAATAISRYIHSAFNDGTGEPTSDSNPLLRRNSRLSKTNPLL